MRTAPIPLRADTLPHVGERIPVPTYDRNRLRAGVVHLGVGGFHRAHEAMYHDRLLNAGGPLEWGICGVGVMPRDRLMRDVLAAQDRLYTLMVKHGDGSQTAQVVGSIAEYLFAPDDREAVIEKMADPAIRIVSLTITEGGYDVAGDPTPRAGTWALLAEALRRRRARGLAPFTVMSCDNLQANGEVARTALTVVAGLDDPALAEWIAEDVSFPSTMVDRITPITTDADRAAVRERFGVDDHWPVVCEPFAQWVVEDDFPAGRPPYEEVGVQVVADVLPYELMKVRLLNGSHQALAYFAWLCGYRLVHEAAQDELIRRFLRAYMREEVAPTLPPVAGVDLDRYQADLIERFSNSAVHDTVARLCEASSDRVPGFVLPAIRDQLATGGEIRRSAAVVASWTRYAEGVDDEGKPIELVDRRAEALTRRALRQRDDPLAFLEDRELFDGLPDAERFVRAYREALASLHADGARATVAALL
jgi:mannitol 2-dehydrogenase